MRILHANHGNDVPIDVTGDPHGHVADLFEDHHPHHAGTGDSAGISQSWADAVGGPRCHAVHEHMSFAASQKSLDVLQGILNSPRGTALQRQHAKSWLERALSSTGLASQDASVLLGSGW